jgi:hypothetical protein
VGICLTLAPPLNIRLDLRGQCSRRQPELLGSRAVRQGILRRISSSPADTQNESSTDLSSLSPDQTIRGTSLPNQHNPIRRSGSAADVDDRSAGGVLVALAKDFADHGSGVAPSENEISQ